MKYKIEGNPNLVKDEESKAILNTDKSGLKAYKEIRKNVRKKDNRIAQLENDVAEIKELLKGILQE